jgi:PLP dependent protein
MHKRLAKLMINAADNLSQIKAHISDAAKRASRKADDICLIAVSKTQSADTIAPLIAAGKHHFGENRVQEAQAKWPALKAATADITLHLIGSLQSNKAEEAVALFDEIHVLDRLSLAEALAKAMIKLGKRPPLYVQVNIGAEPQKGGVSLADLPSFIDQARALDLPLVGLMCIPPADEEPAPHFALLAKLAKRHGLPRLSMGMSADYDHAIQQGATHVRVGSALFGARVSALC